VLSDPRKRQIYDQLGAEGLQEDKAIDMNAIKFQIQMLFGAGEFDDVFGGTKISNFMSKMSKFRYI